MRNLALAASLGLYAFAYFRPAPAAAVAEHRWSLPVPEGEVMLRLPVDLWVAANARPGNRCELMPNRERFWSRHPWRRRKTIAASAGARPFLVVSLPPEDARVFQSAMDTGAAGYSCSNPADLEHNPMELASMRKLHRRAGWSDLYRDQH